MQITEAQLSNAHVSLQRDLSDLRESMHIASINSRKSNLVVTSYPISVDNSLDDFKKFLSDQLHPTDDLIYNYTHSATITVISNNNTASYKALTIASLGSVTTRNDILSVGKRLKCTGSPRPAKGSARIT